MSNVGVNLGPHSDRITFWATYSPIARYQVDMYSGANPYKNTYSGTGNSAEIAFRVWNRISFGLNAGQYEYKKHAADDPAAPISDVDLDPVLKLTTYGFNISYLLPFSEFDKLF